MNPINFILDLFLAGDSYITFCYLQITLPYDTQQLAKATKDTAALYLACGVDTSEVNLLY